MSEPPKDRKRAIANTVMASIFFVMSVAVMLTRASWWATVLMAIISLWALGAVVVNVIAIKTGLPPMEEAPQKDDSQRLSDQS